MNDVIVMSNARKRLFKPKIWRLITGSYILIITFASLNPWFRPRSENNFWSPDKWLHFAAYLGLSILLGLANARLKKNYWLAIMAIAGTLGFGLELVQGVALPFRSFSWHDAASNLAGATLGAIVVKIMIRPDDSSIIK
jgi:VanZ family protein